MKPTHQHVSKSVTGRRRLPGRLAWVLFLFVSRFAAAQDKATFGPEAPASASEVEALRAQLKAEMDANRARAAREAEELARLRAALDGERAAREAAVAQSQLAVDETRRELSDLRTVRSGRFGLVLSGYLQADWTVWRQSAQDQLNPATGAPLNNEAFQIRRARLRVDLDYRMIAGVLEFDGNTVSGATARIIDAEATLRWRNPNHALPNYLALTIGLFKTPFGFEIQQSDRDRLFMERSNMERAMFPGEFDLGIKLQGGWRFLRYQLGAMNGDPLGEKAFPGRDPNQSKDVVGRLGIETAILRRLGVAAGFSVDYGQGFHSGAPATKDSLVWRDTNEDGVVQLNEIGVVPGMTATPSMNFDRYAIGGDLLFTVQLPVVGELTLYGEMVYATNLDRGLQVSDPVAAGRDLRQFGWYAAVTEELTPYGMIGLRYDTYNPDRDSNQRTAGTPVPLDSSYSTLSVAGAVRYPGYARLSFEYEHNTNPLGRLTNGAPTTLADDLFMLRGQVQF